MDFNSLPFNEKDKMMKHFCQINNLPYTYMTDDLLNIICEEEKMEYIGIAYEDFLLMLKDFKTPTEYFTYVNNTINKIRSDIMNHHIFDYFKNDSIELFKNGIDIFKEKHLKEDKKIDHKIPFLFVTLPTPYYASLSFYSSAELFLGEGRYSTFLKHYTSYKPLQTSVWMYRKIFDFDKQVNEKLNLYNEHIFIDLIYPALEKYFPIPDFINQNLIDVNKDGILISLNGFEDFDENDQRDLELCYNITQVVPYRLRELLELPVNFQLYSIQDSFIDWIDFKIKRNYNLYQYIPNLNSNIPKYVCNYDYEYYINERK